MILIRNGRVLTMEHRAVYDPGYVLVDGERILSVGPGDGPPDLVAGPDDRVVDAQGGTILPGFVEAHCHVGLWEDGSGWEGEDGNETSQPVTPHLRALDAITPMDRCFREALAGGVTTVMTGPGSANVLSGQFALLKNRPSSVDRMVMRAPAAMKAALGENPKKAHGKARNVAPMTRMGNAALLREALAAAANYRDRKAAGKDPEYNARWEALLPVLSRDLPLKVHAHRADDILTAVRICREFDLRYTLEHVTEGYLVVDMLAGPEAGRLEGIVTGPLLTDRSKPELKRADIRNPAILAAAGLPVAIMTDHPVTPLQYLPVTAAVAVREGMDEWAALEAITIVPARILGVADRVGSLAPGKDADVVVMTGHPFLVSSRVRMTLVSGQPAYEA